MSDYQENITRHTKRWGKKGEESLKKQARHLTKLETDVAGMLELSSQEFKTAMINRLKGSNG